MRPLLKSVFIISKASIPFAIKRTICKVQTYWNKNATNTKFTIITIFYYSWISYAIARITKDETFEDTLCIKLDLWLFCVYEFCHTILQCQIHCEYRPPPILLYRSHCSLSNFAIYKLDTIDQIQKWNCYSFQLIHCVSKATTAILPVVRGLV